MNAMMDDKPALPPGPQETPTAQKPVVVGRRFIAPDWMMVIFKDHVKTMNRYTEARVRLAMIKAQVDFELEELNEKFNTTFSEKDFPNITAEEMDKAWERLQKDTE